jgi:hypothetical protein
MARARHFQILTCPHNVMRLAATAEAMSTSVSLETGEAYMAPNVFCSPVFMIISLWSSLGCSTRRRHLFRPLFLFHFDLLF